MIRRPPRSTRTDTLFPYTTLLRSPCGSLAGLFCDGAKMGIRPPAYGPNPPSERAMAYSRIVGTGSYLPAQSLSNVQLESRIDTTDEWIFSRTGIRSRHVAAPDEKTSDLGFHASRKALDAAGLDASEVDLIVVATTTPDMMRPEDRRGGKECVRTFKTRG